MAEILGMQGQPAETPDEAKGSYVSISFCHNSNYSFALCYVK